ncbi:MAG: 2-isopropylmalate synthase, partial [Bacteroidales bacterium]|nr:2-isopropylmalate synthase [Bacteroidales bacterium]
MVIEVMDTTLRDGEQTAGVSFNAREKLQLARLLLDELRVDRIEVASARVSEGEYDGVKAIVDWAASKEDMLGRVEVLGFVDNCQSIDWICNSGAKVVNLLCKGSLKLVTMQLRKSPDEHINDILETIDYAADNGISVNLYLEDWSNGIKDSPEYVYLFLDKLKSAAVNWFMIADTLGVLNYEQTYIYCKDMVTRYPGCHFDFHAHNDYDLATANVYASLKAGVQGVHTTVNGLGERAGNVPLSSVVGILNDHLLLKSNIDETKITKVSLLVETISGIRIPDN